MKVTCIESRGTLGGTCLNVGCIPSKALLQSSHMYHDAKHDFEKHGIHVEGLRMDVAGMMKQKNDAVGQLTKGIEGLFKKNKVNYVKGRGSLTDANTIAVDLNDGGTETIKAKNIILATGSDVMTLPGIDIDEKRIVSSTGALDLTEVPKKLTVIGAGVIGLEMGSVWSRLGAEVEFIEFANVLCGGLLDGEVAKNWEKILKKQGLKFKYGAKVTGAKVNGDQVSIDVEDVKSGEKQTTQSDVLLVCVGRKPVTENLGLDNAGVKLDNRGRVEVNDSFQTSTPNIYAIGDIISGPMLAHKAEEEGIAAVETIVKGHGHVNYGAIPNVIYTYPEVASVGLTEEEVKASGTPYNVGKFPFLANSRAKTVAQTDGLVKFIAEKETDKILGIHIIGANAGEMIAEGVLAMEYGASSEDIARTCHAHPTLSEGFKEAAMATYDKPIHS
eukprot:TRINITY_DN9284_c0_g2_i1.p2 TRINITY_DN9284_c0_g2~~TRINITY_DN9284_c0_g2_i1.p2  ORF type:complete len:443 (-),score=185.60 TRINITY_DN9284_c0_g2_i1:215-1543(-)